MLDIQDLLNERKFKWICHTLIGIQSIFSRKNERIVLRQEQYDPFGFKDEGTIIGTYSLSLFF